MFAATLATIVERIEREHREDTRSDSWTMASSKKLNGKIESVCLCDGPDSDELRDAEAASTLFVMNDKTALELTSAKSSTCKLPGHAIVVVNPKSPVPSKIEKTGEGELAVVQTTRSLGCILNQVLHAIEELDRWDEDMVAAILGGRGISDVLQIGCQMLDNPIAVFDSSSALVAMAGNLPVGYESTIWGRVVRDGVSPLEYYTLEEQRRIGRELSNSDSPLLINPSRMPEVTNLAASIELGDKKVATIGQVNISAPFTDAQVFLAMHVRDRLQQALSRDEGEQGGSGGLESHFKKMLAGKPVDMGLVRFQLSQKGWAEDDTYRVLVMMLPKNIEGGIPTLTRLASVEMIIPDGISIVQDGSIVTIEHLGSKGFAKEGRLKSECIRLDMNCGISLEFEGIFKLLAFYEQARLCLSEGEKTGVLPVARYDQIFESLVSRVLSDNVGAGVMCHPKVLELMRNGYKGDLERGREMVKMLYVYLATGRNQHLAARTLFMHRNTLSYRLKCIEEFLGQELAELDASGVFMLEVSCLLALNG
ncbi:MAG: helix-turn-helix domain-containing protein [Coriobacteriales bacterium]|jgi:hypothetical protein